MGYNLRLQAQRKSLEVALPVSFYTLTLADNTLRANGSPEITSTTFPVTTLTPANVAAQQTLMGNLAVAIAGVTIGAVQSNQTVYARNILSSSPAASQLAQRENKWLFRYHDAITSQKATVSVGTADLTALPNNEEFLDLTAGDGLALKTAFEAVVVSPFNSSNATILDSVQFVGRSS